ncbi:hypothetical protein TanjilG_21571 [Lupinus angustifolius]|uniref:RRM domain-containing protein n=1 Tax=Lupinus angustifolius TaxID=3871 RepID=A0A4P1QUE4_LUPAN|nr:PREDICTED: 33 kDa ribonucleoprotein, chloroplastic [Lupinus angustifolius]OIV95181.1 hypothetical protein TanjilG_21571 [Lupinus angustifolius]
MTTNSTLSLSLTPSSSSSYYSSKDKLQFLASSKRCVSFSSLPILLTYKARVLTPFSALVTERENDVVSNEEEKEEEEEQWKKPIATEVYVCNIPRSIDSDYLLNLFKPHGDVLSVEVSRNAETGESKGCAYVTLGSINSARNAVSALDGLDVGGREMRVRFSVEMNRRGKNLKILNSSPRKVIYYEGPHKLYVGNLPRPIRPEELRHLFVKYGTVTSLRILIDQREGRTRVYAFVSFLTAGERDAAMSINGIDFGGRKLVVREGVDKSELS